MVLQGQRRRVTTTIQVPEGWPGSLPEFIAYSTLQRMGKRPGLDFDFQSSLAGGRVDKGGMIIDFMFRNPPDLAINIQGIYYHYEQGAGIQARDLMARQQLAGLGIALIFIDEGAIMENPEYYLQEALRYRDHSRLGAGG
jgi:hypothetical protein